RAARTGARAGGVGDRGQGHGDRLPRRDHAARRPVRSQRPVRVALPHPRPRGPRHDATDGDRQAAKPERIGGHMYNRRELVTLTLAGLAAPIFNAYVFTRGRDTAVGVQTRSFRDLHRLSGADPIDGVIAALVSCRVHHCELFAPQIEPQFVMPHGHHGMSSMARQMMRRELRKWRLRAPESQFRAIGQRFEMAGIAIAAFDYSPDASFSDEEIDAGFVMAKALGAEILTASAAPDIAARIAPFADRHRMVVALRGDAAAADPNAVGSV